MQEAANTLHTIDMNNCTITATQYSTQRSNSHLLSVLSASMMKSLNSSGSLDSLGSLNTTLSTLPGFNLCLIYICWVVGLLGCWVVGLLGCWSSLFDASYTVQLFHRGEQEHAIQIHHQKGHNKSRAARRKPFRIAGHHRLCVC